MGAFQSPTFGRMSPLGMRLTKLGFVVKDIFSGWLNAELDGRLKRWPRKKECPSSVPRLALVKLSLKRARVWGLDCWLQSQHFEAQNYRLDHYDTSGRSRPYEGPKSVGYRSLVDVIRIGSRNQSGSRRMCAWKCIRCIFQGEFSRAWKLFELGNLFLGLGTHEGIWARCMKWHSQQAIVFRGGIYSSFTANDYLSGHREPVISQMVHTSVGDSPPIWGVQRVRGDLNAQL